MIALFLSILLPLMFANIVHMVFIKKDYLAVLKTPLSISLFGANKTYRGFVVVGFFSFLFVEIYQVLNSYLFHSQSIWDSIAYPSLASFSLGIIYCLGELPNSYLKRKMGVAPGKTSQRYKYAFILLDHIDSNVPSYLFLCLFSSLSIINAIIFSLITILIHFATNYLLFVLGIRKNAL
jgi:CDP-diacylglycerol--serine O-phosphatidyltransferase